MARDFEFSDEMKIAVVGGGPVGLITAILLKRCTLYEKRPKYTREQYLVTGGTKSNVFNMIPKELRSKLFEKRMCFIDNPADDRIGACFLRNPGDTQDWKKHHEADSYFSTIKIADIEKTLMKWIKDQLPHVTIIKKEFTNDDAKDYNVVIGTDGTKSVIREKLMKEKWNSLEGFTSYILHIIYTDKSNAKYRINIPEQIDEGYRIARTSDEDNCAKRFAQDRFRLIRSNGTKTQFMLQIPESDYKKIKKLTTFGELPTKLKEAVVFDTAFMNSKPTNLNNTKITSYEQKIGCASNFAKIVDGKLFMLLGDSAMVNHIFTGEGLGVDWSDMLFVIERYSAHLYNFPTIFKKRNPRYKSLSTEQLISDYNRQKFESFNFNIKYKAYLKAIPYQLLKTICAKMNKFDYRILLMNAGIHLDKNVSINKNELCLILRDYVLRSFSILY